MSSRNLLLDVKWEVDHRWQMFRDALPGRELVNWADPAAHSRDLSDIHYAVVWKPEPGLLAKLPALEVIFSLGAGVDHVLSDATLPDKPLVRFVDPNLTGRMVEWVVLQVLMHMRQQRGYDALQQASQWQELSHPQASDFRVGLMGFGELGQACVPPLQALGFNLNAWSRSPKQVEGVKAYAGEEALGEFLSATDILVALLPHTPQTDGILNRDLFEALSRSGPFGAPVIINGGRGGSQVEADIVASLEDGTLKGVSLDVFEAEPLAKNSPLWGFNQAVVTPHVAAVSDPQSLATHVARQIERFESGQPLEHLVDRERGY